MVEESLPVDVRPGVVVYGSAAPSPRTRVVDIGLPTAAVCLARWILQPAVISHRHHATGCYVIVILLHFRIVGLAWLEDGLALAAST